MSLLDWSLILVFALLRFILSFKYSLGVDEAHYALYGLNPDWSYFDHPSLVGWVQFLFISLFGVHDWVVRLPAILSGVISSVLVFRISAQISGQVLAARWSVLALNVSFLSFGLFLMFLPDTLLLPLVLWLILITERVIEKPSLQNWLWMGLCLGLCGLAKYTAILLVPSLIIISWQENVWKKWLSWKIVPGIVISGLCVLPVLYWNWKHEWISFAYQTGHVVGENHYSVQSFFSSLAGQIIAYSPFLVLASLATLVVCKDKTRLTRTALWVVTPCAAFFLYSGFKGFVLPHWSFVVFVVLFLCAFAEAFRQSKMLRVLKTSTWLTMGVLLVVLVELFFHVIPFKDYKTAYGDVTGWSELRHQLMDYRTKNPQIPLSIGVANWTLGARTKYYFSDVAPVFVLDNRYDQFDIWEGTQKPSANMILFRWSGFDFEQPLNEICESSEVLYSNTFRQKNYIITSVDTILCRGYHKSEP